MSKFIELKEAILTWRRAEKNVATSVLKAHHPDHIIALRNVEERALGTLRILVDSEPWTEIEHNFSGHLGAVAPLVPKGQDEKMPTARAGQTKRGIHGIDCTKVTHIGSGYLHAEEDDSSYNVDGAQYCGRCHRAL